MRFAPLFVLILAVLVISGCTQPSGNQQISSVEVSDQQINAGAVTITKITAKEDGWMTIHADNNGQAGEVIGNEPVRTGESRNFVVSIDQSKVTETLYAMLHVDRGQIGVYEFPGVDVPAEENGVMINVAFKTTTAPLNIIEMRSSGTGFSPKTLTIKRGEAVTFINKESATHWPASATHPTHTVYPGSDINKCGTSEAAAIFDACHGMSQNEEWSFTFNTRGNWSYHDHLNPSLWGNIVVE